MELQLPIEKLVSNFLRYKRDFVDQLKGDLTNIKFHKLQLLQIQFLNLYLPLTNHKTRTIALSSSY